MTNNTTAAIDGSNVGILPLSRKRLADQIADIIRDQILLGEFTPGRNIPERETALALGVSRTPLREALLILEGEGLVSMAPARSPIVANPSLEDLTQLLLVQSALESLAGECACENITDHEFDHIENLHNEMVMSADDASAIDFFSKDMAFHQAIVAASKNTPLIKTHTQYHSRLWRARFLSSGQKIKKRSETLREHANILGGLRRRNKTQTSKALEQHLRAAITNIASIYADQNSN